MQKLFLMTLATSVLAFAVGVPVGRRFGLPV